MNVWTNFHRAQRKESRKGMLPVMKKLKQYIMHTHKKMLLVNVLISVCLHSNFYFHKGCGKAMTGAAVPQMSHSNCSVHPIKSINIAIN